jgi:hypothetical protein
MSAYRSREIATSAVRMATQRPWLTGFGRSGIAVPVGAFRDALTHWNFSVSRRIEALSAAWSSLGTGLSWRIVASACQLACRWVGPTARWPWDHRLLRLPLRNRHAGSHFANKRLDLTDFGPRASSRKAPLRPPIAEEATKFGASGRAIWAEGTQGGWLKGRLAAIPVRWHACCRWRIGNFGMDDRPPSCARAYWELMSSQIP